MPRARAAYDRIMSRTQIFEPAARDPDAETTVIQVAGHELMLFVESAPMIAQMVADIRTAQSRVWLETYIFAGDATGRLIADALIERAQAGVDVRLLYDAIGSQSTSAELLAKIEAAGVKVHGFHSLLYALRNLSFFEILNRRNHRKLLVIDDRVAFFGGMNIVDHPAGAHAPSTAARSGRCWRLAGCSRAHGRPASHGRGRKLRALLVAGPSRADRSPAAHLSSRPIAARQA